MAADDGRIPSVLVKHERHYSGLLPISYNDASSRAAEFCPSKTAKVKLMSTYQSPQSNSFTLYIAEMFNDMAGEYDNLSDLWYRHTFGFIDDILTRRFVPATMSPPVRALDVGSGTGLQSFRLASLGYDVDGIDISAGLLDIARRKAVVASVPRCRFHFADAREIPFEAQLFDVVNCCGPTLSFIPEWDQALGQIGRCLKPSGRLLLEVEGKWNPDLFWEIISAFAFDCFGYEEDIKTALSHLKPPWSKGHLVNYAFKRESGESVLMPLKTFTFSEIRDALSSHGIHVSKHWGLHTVSNLIPSPLLHNSHPSRLIRRLFSLLGPVDRLVAPLPGFRSFGCSLLVEGVKV